MIRKKTVKKDNKEKKENKGSGKRMKKQAMVQAVMEAFQASSKESFNYKQISKILGLEAQVQKLMVVDILYDLAADDFISEIDRGRYRYNGIGTLAVVLFALSLLLFV